MRYLKTYKLFEASWYDIKDHIDVLSDMSMYLWDKEFNVQVADEIISREHQCIVVNIVKKGSKKFTYPEIKQELLEMVGYMDREGWEILNMEFTHIAAGPLYCKLDGDKLVNMSGEEIDYQFDQLIVKFVEKDIKTNESTEEDIHRERMIKKYGLEALEECDSIISNVKDMLLELELDGLEIFTSINYTPLTLMGIEKTPKLFLNIKCGSKLWDSNESLIDGVISTIKEFVGSYGYVVGTNFRKEEKRQVTIPIIDIYEVEYQMLIQK